VSYALQELRVDDVRTERGRWMRHALSF